MKKTTRVLVALLALTLVTSCFVGGTFAKYVTESNGLTDSARVAEWGVTVVATAADADGMFSTAYAADDPATGIATTVDAETEDVVAPGTAGDLGTLAIEGTPEVAVKVTKTAALTLANWEVDLTDDGVDNATYYCPIVIDVNGTKFYGLDYADATAFKADVEAAITAGTDEYAPNTDLSAEDLDLDISWEWAFESANGTAVNASDAADTALGDAAVNGTAATIALNFTAKVEQID